MNFVKPKPDFMVHIQSSWSEGMSGLILFELVDSLCLYVLAKLL